MCPLHNGLGQHGEGPKIIFTYTRARRIEHLPMILEINILPLYYALYLIKNLLPTNYAYPWASRKVALYINNCLFSSTLGKQGRREQYTYTRI